MHLQYGKMGVEQVEFFEYFVSVESPYISATRQFS